MFKNKIGLFGKYILKKANGNPIDVNARYFVLRYDKDPAALEALKKYAECTGNRELKIDLLAAIASIEEPKGFFGSGCTMDNST